MRYAISRLVPVILLFAVTSAHGLPAIELQQVASGLSSPVAIENAGDGTGRLFIVEQDGRVRILDGTQLLPTPFLDIITLVACCGERGLLGLAFHPRFNVNRQFYVFYTASYPDGDPRPDGDLVIARYLASAADPNVADPASGSVILTIPHSSETNHNGGKLAFGSDGFLYIATGDGGGSGDPSNNAQNLDSLLGKILRIDVDSATPYAIPAGNPFANQGGARPEIWVYGLRNPWRFSFDRLTGDMFIGDVGQGTLEEIDFQAFGTSGQDYGWRLMEGTLCFNPSTGCDNGGLTLPILEYGRTLGYSVTGGYRYRGLTYPQASGVYLYGDFGSGRIWGATPDGSAWTTELLIDTTHSISTFGESENGEIYLAHYGGSLFRVTFPPAFVRSDFDRDGKVDIIWRNRQTGQTHIWMMDRTAYRGSIVLPSVSAEWHLVATGDFDRDGHTDLVWRNQTTGESHIWRMTGSVYSGSAVLPLIPLPWQIEAAADFNGDGGADVVWRNQSTGQTHIWLMNGFSYSGSVVLPPVPGSWRVETAADLNTDGHNDIVWRNSTTNETHIWLMKGARYLGSRVLPVVPGDWEIRASGDYDGNGHNDLVWRNSTTSETHIWLLNGGHYQGSLVLPLVSQPWIPDGS